MVSGGINVFDIYQLYVNFTYDAEYARGKAFKPIGHVGEVSFEFEFNHKNPSVYIFFLQKGLLCCGLSILLI